MSKFNYPLQTTIDLANKQAFENIADAQGYRPSELLNVMIRKMIELETNNSNETGVCQLFDLTDRVCLSQRVEAIEEEIDNSSQSIEDDKEDLLII